MYSFVVWWMMVFSVVNGKDAKGNDVILKLNVTSYPIYSSYKECLEFAKEISLPQGTSVDCRARNGQILFNSKPLSKDDSKNIPNSAGYALPDDK